ncbi:MAG: glycosyltransferase [Rhodobacteraceae bacterium]|nr:glycosyltransferase [Paracoccaceae bacterium]
MRPERAGRAMAWERGGYFRRDLEAKAAQRRPPQKRSGRGERKQSEPLDLDAAPPDPDLLRDADFEAYALTQAIPWRRQAHGVIWAAADPVRAEAMLISADGRSPEVRRAVPAAIDRALRGRFAEMIAERAAFSMPRDLSARAGAAKWQLMLVALLLMGGLALSISAPALAWTALVLGLTALVAVTSALRVALLTVVLRSVRQPRPAIFAQPLIPPRFALLVPLAREAGAVPALIDALISLDYPKDRLRALLLVEADDVDTQAAIAAVAPPEWIETFIVPPGEPRTKPRAMNAALPFIREEIVGIYDAEDRPDPRQLWKVATAFARAEPDVACIQARLAWYNSRENWLTRCLSIEYAVWFDLQLTGLRMLRLPIPLGGTSVFFRADILKRLGGWDAHNVTEDADLGLRLVRAGWRCGLVDSDTQEEAACKFWPWVKQRSRWIKGYMQTWIAHMRHPWRAMREFGLWGFCGVQALLLGAVVSYLAQPLFWIAVIWRLWSGDAIWGEAQLGVLGAVFVALLITGQVVVMIAAIWAVHRRKMGWLIPCCLSLLIYWPLGACAAYKALWELILYPFHWDKTEHAVSPAAQAMRAQALTRLARRREEAA